MKKKVLIISIILFIIFGSLYYYFLNKKNLYNQNLNVTQTVTIYDKYKDIKINTWSMDSNDTLNNYSISFPATNNEKINKVLEDYSNDFLKEFEKVSKEFAKIVSPEAVSGITFNQHFDVFLNSDKYIGFILDQDRNYGNDSGIVYKTFIFNKNTGEDIGIESIFKDKSYLEFLSKISKDKLLKDLEKEISSSIDNSTQKAIDEYRQGRIDDIQTGTAPIKENFSNLEFSTSSITIKFNKFQVGPGFIGTPSIVIKLSDISDYIKPEFLSALQDSDKSTTIEIKAKVENQNNIQEIPTKNTKQSTGSIDCKIEKCIALTFDDGPSVYTDKLLNILEEKNIKATFFLIGRSVKIQASTIIRMYTLGNQIGNHTWDHPDLRKLTIESIKSQINRTDEAISSITSIRPSTIRTPYGVNTPEVRSLLDRPIILWNVDSKDWSSKNTDSIIKEMIDAKSGSIILSHDIYPQTVAAIPYVIDDYLSKGYKFVTVSELFSGQALKAGSVYFGLR